MFYVIAEGAKVSVGYGEVWLVVSIVSVTGVKIWTREGEFSVPLDVCSCVTCFSVLWCWTVCWESFMSAMCITGIL